MSELQAEVTRMGAEAVKMLKARSGSTPDFSEASLVAVEEALDEACEYFPSLQDDQARKLVQWFGCYILEVGRMQFGGTYQWYEKREQPVLIVGEPQFHVALITWDRVKSRLTGDKGDNIPFFFDGFAERVRRAEVGDRALYV